MGAILDKDGFGITFKRAFLFHIVYTRVTCCWRYE